MPNDLRLEAQKMREEVKAECAAIRSVLKPMADDLKTVKTGVRTIARTIRCGLTIGAIVIAVIVLWPK